MTAGRKPLPSQFHIIRGNPGHRPINKMEPKPKPEIPTCPRQIQGEARKEWRRIVKELHAIGLVSRLDRTALAAYCDAYSRWIEGMTQVAKYGMVVKAPSGYPIVSPYLSIINAALAQMKAFLVEFGMTPSSRSRIKAGNVEEDNQGDRFQKPKITQA
jgi:P27 family predicted phage terminase small subunit